MAQLLETQHSTVFCCCSDCPCAPVQGVFVAPDAPKPEEVPPGAVDSAGNPVNVLLYTQFWELQVHTVECHNVINCPG